ncbi:MAG: UbiA family prenyltransferase [Bacteroidota bacterium]
MKVADAAQSHWVNRAPEPIRPYLQLSRLDRPVGYWLLALPGWIGLMVPAWQVWSPLYWGTLILLGAIAMRGAGCTYNDIVDRDLDAQVDRTASRPLPSARVSLRQAWVWLALPIFPVLQFESQTHDLDQHQGI